MLNLEKESGENVSILMNFYHRENEQCLSFLADSLSGYEEKGKECSVSLCDHKKYYDQLPLKRTMRHGSRGEILRGSNARYLPAFSATIGVIWFWNVSITRLWSQE